MAAIPVVSVAIIEVDSSVKTPVSARYPVSCHGRSCSFFSAGFLVEALPKPPVVAIIVLRFPSRGRLDFLNPFHQRVPGILHYQDNL